MGAKATLQHDIVPFGYISHVIPTNHAAQQES